MEDVRALAGLVQVFHRRPAEEGKAHRVVVETVKRTTVEKIVLRVGLDEKALAPVDKAEPHGAGHGRAVPRHPEIFIDFMQAPDLVVPHAIVLGQNDLDRVPTDLDLTAQPVDHIGEPTDFGYGSQFC